MTSSHTASKVSWDYTEHAPHYDKRADYSSDAVDALLRAIAVPPSERVVEIGAGTGKLTKELLARGLSVMAIEPNEAMRAIGIENTKSQRVDWQAGTGEATGLPKSSAFAALFGSSFNVVNQALALSEACRILIPNGWFACMWNHRDLDDPIQQRIESIIRSSIPTYSYGSRREDPTHTINMSGYFTEVRSIESRFVWKMSRADIVAAWRSHATLKRQAGSNAKFGSVIEEISKYLDDYPEVINIPYSTRIYFAQKESKDCDSPSKLHHRSP